MRQFPIALLIAMCACDARAEILAEGEVEIGLTFLSEFHDPGVEVVGILPREVSEPTALGGFVSVKAKSREATKALSQYLSSSEAAQIYKAMGMQAGR